MSGGDGGRGVARRAGRALAALAAAGLAGCSALDGSDGAGGADGANGADGPGESASRTGGMGTEDPGGCSPARQEELRRRIDALEAEDASSDGAAGHVEALSVLVEQLEEGFPEGVLRAAERVGREARESVLMLEVYVGEERVGGGTGWYVDDSHVATNAHVVGGGLDPDEVRGVTVDGDEVALEPVESVESLQPDVALLSADRTGRPLPTAREIDLERGQPLVQVGHPADVGYWVVSAGRFVGAAEYVGDEGSYTSLSSVVPGRQGVSGSPLLDLDGTVVGMTEGVEHPNPREFGEPATPASPALYDVPLAVVAVSTHVGADTVRELRDAWT